MRLFVTLISVAAFLLHITLGCCAHHAHANEHPANDAQPRRISEVFENRTASIQETPVHCPGSECEGDFCTFLTAKQNAAPKPEPLKLFAVAANVPLRATMLACASPLRFEYGESPDLPVRRHLFNQVLLN